VQAPEQRVQLSGDKRRGERRAERRAESRERRAEIVALYSQAVCWRHHRSDFTRRTGKSVASNYTDRKLFGYKCNAYIDDARGRQR
jgi:hypothetical protein